MSQKSNRTEKEKDNKNGLIILFAVLGTVIVLLLVVVAFLLGRGAKTDGGAVERTDGSDTRQVAGTVRMVADEASARTVMEEMHEEVAEGMFKCDMTMTWNYRNGGEKSEDAYVANNADNSHPIYFDVTLKDTDELIYSSPVLEVGNSLAGFSLDKKLEAGTYKAKVRYTLVTDTESQEPISSANFIITLNVLD